MKTKLCAAILTLALLLSACGFSEKATGAAQTAPMPADTAAQAPAEGEFHNTYSLTKLRMIGKGSEASGYKLSFHEPESFDGIEGYIVCYSVCPTEQVWDCLKALDREGVLALDKPVNRAYVITDLSYCDGVGNTLNTSQKDVVTGKDFSEAGTHFFYVAAFGADGVMSLEQAEQTVTLAASAGELTLRRDGDVLTGTFISTIDGTLERNFVFFSSEGYAAVKEQLKGFDRAALDAMEEDGRAVGLKNADYNEFSLSIINILDMTGKPLEDTRFYYAYLASASLDEMLGLSYCDDSFVTPDTLPKSSGTIGTGEGILFPNGGAATIGSGRSSIISTSQGIFSAYPDTPRVAVIGAPSGSEQEIWSYFYQDDSSVKSFQNRFADAGFEAVYIPLTAENGGSVGNDEYFAALVSSCHGVYFTGGDQSLGIYALTDENGSFNKVGKAVLDLFSRGGFLAGTSAGAHMLGSVCYQDAYPLAVLTHTQPKRTALTSSGVSCGSEGALYAGLPCDEAASGHTLCFDSHFGARGRLGRLCVMQKAGNADYAVGLDEATGLAVSGGIGTAYGAGTVTIIDARSAVYGDDENHFAVTGLRLYILSTGDRFDFASGELLPAASRTVAAGDMSLFVPDELLGGGSTQTKALLSFAGSGEKSASFGVEADGQSFTFTLSRGEDFAAYTDEKSFTSSTLEDYKRMAIGGIVLDIS